MASIKSREKIEISSHGPHQLALRRRSVKVFEGAIKVLTMRAPSKSGAESIGDAGTGRTGAAVMMPPAKIRRNSNLDRTSKQAIPGLMGCRVVERRACGALVVSG